MPKIKKTKLKEKIENVSFEPTHIKFNFSFITYCENFDNEHKIQFVNRLFDLSKESYLVVSGWPKEIGFENVPLNIKKEIHPNFANQSRTFDGKYTRNEELLNRIFLEEILGGLSREERELIYMRYFCEETQTKIAQKMGISQVQVSRMEKKILSSLRKKL